MSPASDRIRASRMPAGGMLAVLLLLVWTCSRPADGPQEPGATDEAERANVVVILVDTLRADHLGVAGYPRPTSPGLDALAARGVFFERFYSHSAITRPSVATLLTSRYMSGHGVLGHGGHALPADVAYLPELLRDAGFHTGAFVTSPQIHPELGFARGFERFTPLYSADIDPKTRHRGDLVKVPAAQVFDTVRRALAADPDEPFFYYVHLQDPHGPYEVTPAEAAAFFDGSYEGDVTGSLQDFARIGLFRSDPEALAYFKALYDAEIAGMDRALGDFVAWLDDTGRLADTHVIVTADHGEELMEHGRLGHSYYVHEELLRVPLVWIGPGVPRGRRVDALAGLVDVAPTLFDLLGLEPPETSMVGRSLRPLWSGDLDAETDTETDTYDRSALFVENVERRPDKSAPLQTSRALVTATHKVWGGSARWSGRTASR